MPGVDLDRLRALDAQGMSQRAMAAELGCSQSTVRYWLSRETATGQLPGSSGDRATPTHDSIFAARQRSDVTKATGERSEAVALSRFIEAGCSVSLPFGESCRYDMVVDDGLSLHRVQVKTGRSRGGVVLFHTASMHYHRDGGGQRHYIGDVDFFAVYCPDNGEFYVVPVDHLPGTGGRLRLDPPKNGAVKGVRFASDYIWPLPPREHDLVVHLHGKKEVAGSSPARGSEPS